MVKKFNVLSLFCLLLLSSCGNEESDYPSGGTGQGNTGQLPYKTFTFVFYKKPYTMEMLYHFLRLANFNKIESSYFIPMDIEGKNYKKNIDDFVEKENKPINMISILLVPKEIPELDKFKTLVNKAVFLFPTEKPELPAGSSMEPTNSTDPVAAHEVHVFPENFNYIENILKMRYALQNKSFLVEMLKYLAEGNVNKPSFNTPDEIAYIQGITQPNADIRLLQGDISTEFKEKSSIKALDDGSIVGIPIDPRQTTQVQASYGGDKAVYWVEDLGGSFLFFDFAPILTKHILINSYFTPIDIERLLFAGKPVKIDIPNKAIFILDITLTDQDSKGETQWSGNYKEGVLSLSLPKDLAPITYLSKDDRWSLVEQSYVQSFKEVKDTKKDYEKKNAKKGAVIFSFASEDGETPIIDEGKADVEESKEIKE